jgi:hypothetical protein
MYLPLQRLAANEIRPPADLRGDALFCEEASRSYSGRRALLSVVNVSVWDNKIRAILDYESVNSLWAP